MSKILPVNLLEKLKENANPKVQETLDAIYKVCEQQLKQGLYDFSIATISRAGHQKGVPKAQSIRNKSGEKYRGLITCFAENNTNKAKFNQNTRHHGIRNHPIASLFYPSIFTTNPIGKLLLN